MNTDVTIRSSRDDDLTALQALYPRAFPNEDLLPVLRELLDGATPVLSLVAVAGADLLGHVIFTPCGITDGEEQVALLGPLGVMPAQQGHGIGTALVQAGFKALLGQGIHHVYVLGDPLYYGRFGFAAESLVMPPYPLPDAWSEAWQSVALAGSSIMQPGALSVPEAWQNPALWS